MYQLSKRQLDNDRGMTRRRTRRNHDLTCNSNRAERYRAALAAMSTAPLTCTASVALSARIRIHITNHAAVHEYEGSQAVTRARFDAYIDTQRSFALIGNKFKALLGDRGVCAWGSANWGHARKGMAPCPSAMLYRYLRRQPWARVLGSDGVWRSRFPLENEFRSSCVCSQCLCTKKMAHPRHKRVYQKVWRDVPAAVPVAAPAAAPPNAAVFPRRKRIRELVEPPNGGEVTGLFQAVRESCMCQNMEPRLQRSSEY